jgi:formate/nitrite transporter
MGGGSLGLKALEIAAAKCEIGFVEAFARGILCNALVCLAVWLCHSARSTTDKILAIIWPIAGFVALGFEHSIANMYFIPFGILLKLEPEFMAAAPDGAVITDALTLGGFTSNLIPVTLGNIVGGTLFVAGIYWFVYLRRHAWGGTRAA